MLACSCSLAWARTLSRAHRSPLSLVSLALWLSLSLSHSLSRSSSLSLSRSHALSRTLSRSLLLSRSLTLSLSVSLSHILALSFSLAHAFVRAHARAPSRHALPQRLAGFLSSALGLSPQLACSRAQQEQSPQHACSPTAPRRRPQQRPRPLTTACLHAGAAATAPFPPLCGVGQAHSSSSLQKSPLRQAACGCHGARGGTLSPAAPRLARVAAGASRRAARRPTAAIAH